MQGLKAGRGSSSTVNDLSLHSSSTSKNSRASSRTSVERAPTVSDALSVSDVSSVSSVPVNDSTWRWWEAAAEDILRGPDLQSIRLLCRYHIYKDDSTLESILRKRWPSRLNSFLLRLSGGTYSRSDVTDLDLDQKVQEILKRLVPSVPTTNTQRDLASSALLLEQNEERLTSKLNDHSLLRFREITFADLVREALYPERTVESVIEFGDWHDSLFNIVSQRLEHFPEEAAKYAQIEQRLPEGSPVRWAVSESLRQADRPDLELASQPNLGFIFDALGDLFRDQDRDLAGILRQLAVLEARFHRDYLWENDINWTHRFDTNTNLFDLVATTPAPDLATSLTEDDHIAFQKISPQDVIDEDSNFRYLHKRWNELCQALQESIAGDNGLIPRLTSLAMELYIRHNYYSLCAVLQALQGATFDKSPLQFLFKLIESERNYSSYRQAHESAPGLPFLPPHVQQLKHDEEKALCEVFSFRRCDLVQAERQEPGGKQPQREQRGLSWKACVWATIRGVISCSAARRVGGRGAAPRYT